MNKISISMVREIEDHLRKIQGGLIQNRRKDISFTTVINMVLLSGILSTNDFTENTWEHIQKFIENQTISLNSDGQTKAFIDKLKDL